VKHSAATKPVVVLVVEDEMLVRMSAADILQDAGYHVVEARDGVEAIALLEMRDDVGVMLTDIAMPNIDGSALVKIVNERWPGVGIVVTSGAIPLGLQLDLPPGARFLSKPYTPAKLTQEVEAVSPRLGAPVDLKSIPTLQAGKAHGAGGLAQPLSEPDE
jgi:CheY-like chemotaxis protein